MHPPPEPGGGPGPSPGDTLAASYGLEGQVALVTGAATSIGAQICATLSALGVHVYVTDILAGEAATVAQEITEAGRRATAVALDVTDPQACSAAVRRVLDESGSLQILICNAGWTETHPLLQESPDYWRRVVEVNYLGVVHACAAALEPMREASYGRIVNISSEAGRVGMPRESVYAGAKGGVIAFTKSLAREGASRGVLANAISPGLIESPAVDKYDEAGRAAILRNVPLRRVGTQEEVANVVAFLASRVASYITGEVLSVGGGVAMAG